MLIPMFCLILLTFLVGVKLVTARIASVKNQQVSIKYYRYNSGEEEVPEILIKTGKNFSNLLETPLLFYIACTLYISLNVENLLGIALAWIYVAVRCIHSYIHLSSNNVVYRMYAFLASFACILFLWINLMVSQL
ncbi:MAG: MAPEG family protein [Agarilytica sp.]